MAIAQMYYGTVTSVLTDPDKGAQLCHVKSHLSDQEFQNCEIITPKGLNYLPKVNDLVLVVEHLSGEICVLGVLEPMDLQLNQGEVLMHAGVKNGYSYSMKASIKIDQNYNITLTAQNGGTITLGADGSITIAGSSIKLTSSQEGFFGHSAASQPGAITNADGTLGGNQTAINAVLDALRSLGLIST